MKKFFRKLIDRHTCSHKYKYQDSSYERALARPHSEYPYWYMEYFIELRCSECGKEIKKTYDWCIANNLPTHQPFNRGRNKNRNKGKLPVRRGSQ